MNHGINYSEPAMTDMYRSRRFNHRSAKPGQIYLRQPFYYPSAVKQGSPGPQILTLSDIRASRSPYRVSSSRSRSTPFASSGAANPPDHVQGSLRLKPLALASSLDHVMKRVIARSIQQQGLSASGKHDISASNHLDHYNASMDTMHSISESPRPLGASLPTLVVLQRAQDKVVQALVQRDAIPAAPEHSEDRVSGSYRLRASRGMQRLLARARGDKAQQSGAGQIDTEEIAEQVWRIMAERLVVEQERRGLAKWP